MRFSDMLDRKAEEIKQPPLLPAGEYMLQVKKQPEQEDFVSAKGGKFDRLTFELQVVSPIEVDEDALEAFGKVAGVPLRRTFYFSQEEDEDRSREITLAQIKAFLISLGCFEDSMSLAEGLAGAPGCQCRADVVHRPDPSDIERFFVEISKTYAV